MARVKNQKSIRVIPPAPNDEMHPQIHVYYGYGKGKTTCCVGLAIRALGAGKKVALVQFDKGYDGQTEHYSERYILRQLDGIVLHPTGCERMLSDGSFRFGADPEDKAEAQRGLEIAERLILEGTQHVLILDEILAAAAYDLIEQSDVMNLLDVYDQKRCCELVLSGHKVWDTLLDRVDLVTEMHKVKHYYAKGIPARLGIEF